MGVGQQTDRTISRAAVARRCSADYSIACVVCIVHALFADCFDKSAVSIVLKYWIEHQFFDLDERTRARLCAFIEHTLSKSHKDMATRLLADIEQHGAANTIASMFDVRPRLTVPDFGMFCVLFDCV